MKKLLLTLVIGTFGWSYTVKDSRFFQVKKEPDVLTTSFHVSYKNKEMKEVRKYLKNVNNIVNLKEMCKSGGQYRIEPEYRYEEPIYRYEKINERFVGYRGSMSYSQCDVKDKLEEYDKMIKLIRSTGVHVSLSPITPSLSAELRDKLKTELKVIATLYAKKDTNKRYDSKCEIQEIDFSNNAHGYQVERNVFTSKTKTGSSFEPIIRGISVSLYAQYEYKCKE